MLLYQLVDEFQKSKIAFIIVGGYAMALQGVIRSTMDIDLVLHLKLLDYDKAEKSLKKMGLQSRIPARAEDIIKMRKEYIEKRNLLAWSFVDFKDPSRQIDILITKDIAEIEFERIPVAGRRIPVATVESLIKMKTESDRDQDRIDVQKLKEKLLEKK